MIDELTGSTSSRGKTTVNYKKRDQGSESRGELPKATIFKNPMVNVPLLKQFLENPNANISTFADYQHRSAGQMMQIINTTARAIVSYLNENVDPNILTDVYKHRHFFLKSIKDYTRIEAYKQMFSSDKQWYDYFMSQSELKRMMLRDALDDLIFKQENEHND